MWHYKIVLIMSHSKDDGVALNPLGSMQFS